MFFNRIATLICFVVIYSAAVAQVNEPKSKFGDVRAEDFKPVYYSLDSSADAVCLYEEGKTQFIGGRFEGYSVVFQMHKRIRLLKKKSFDELAAVQFPLYIKGEITSALTSLQAVTYNLTDGRVYAENVGNSNIFNYKEANTNTIKFTFPDLKEGSIIEYKYSVTILSFVYIPTWTFQSTYPTLWSEYSIELPPNFDFGVLIHGYLKPVIDTSTTISGGTVKHTWAYANIPALKKENYITALSDYQQSVEFQLSTIRYSDIDEVHFLQSWPEAAKELMKNENFGQDLNKDNRWLDDDLNKAIANEKDDLTKAKKIFEYVRDNYSCTDYSSMFLSQSLKKTQQSKKGNVADVNMLLIALLIRAGLNTSPVILSTRDHGKTYDMYPILDKYNYVIARLNIGDRFYLLDASVRHLGFGHLGQNCYNGPVRVISKQPLSLNLSSDSLHDVSLTGLFLINDENNKITGAYRSVLGEMGSYNMRENMKNSNSAEYFQNLKKSFLFDVNLDNLIIDSLDQFEMPVFVQYDISFKPEGDIIYFDPMFSKAIKENPFSAAQRFYPVEMPFCTDDTYVLNMDVPSGYKVDELPRPEKVGLNETDGIFEYLIQQTGNHIQLNCRLRLNKANFEPRDYETLRNFFSIVVEKENEQIVFKKE